MSEDILNRINSSTNYLQNQLGNKKPIIGLILGSGLGNLADEIKNAKKIEYSKIPGFPVSTVEGHSGRLVAGKLENMQVIAMQGRFHYYEGYSLRECTLPVRVMKNLGVQKLIITNAAGGVNKNFRPGDLMLITDHINFAMVNPLRGKNLDSFGVRFPDMSNPYDHELIKIAKESAKSEKINLKEGVYLFNSGPSYETPAEIKMARIFGADAVGMSTVPEVIVAVHCGIRVLGISCITNMAAGILNQPLSHKEVIETTELVKEKFIKLVKKIIKDGTIGRWKSEDGRPKS